MPLPFRRFMGVVLMSLLALLSPAHAEVRQTSVWWLPRNVNMFGHEIDFIFYLILWLTGVTAVAVFTVMIYFLVKYRARPGVPAIHSHGNNTLEVIWTTIPVFIFLALAIYGNEQWTQMRLRTPPADALPVAVVGEQFGWNVRYPGPDGKLAKMVASKVGKDNPFGVDPADPDGMDDFTTYNDIVFRSIVPCGSIWAPKMLSTLFTFLSFACIKTWFPGACMTLCGSRLKRREIFNSPVTSCADRATTKCSVSCLWSRNRLIKIGPRVRLLRLRQVLRNRIRFLYP